VGDNSSSSSESSVFEPWLPGWGKRIRFRVDSTKVDEDLSDFTALLHLSATSGIGSDDVTAVFDEVGGEFRKIAVTTGNGTTECYVEVATWLGNSKVEDESSSSSSQDDETSSSSSGTDNREAWIWFKAPHINAAEDTIFYLYYDSTHADNTSFVGEIGSTPGQTAWSSDHIGVWHLDEGGEGTRNDSTSNGLDATPQNYDANVASAGKVAGADDLDGVDQYLNITDNDLLTFTVSGQDQPFSYGMWMNGTLSGTTSPLAKASGFNAGEYYTLFNGSTIIARCIYNTGGAYIGRVTNNTFSNDTWYYVVVTYSGSEVSTGIKIYVNGSEEATSANNSGSYAGMQNTSNDLRIGRRGGGNHINGQLDEARMWNTEVSASAVKADYNSQNDTLLTFEGEDLESSSSSSVSSSSVSSSSLSSSSLSSSSSSLSSSSVSSSSSESTEHIWHNSIALTIPKERVDAALTDFPVLIHLSDACGIADSGGSQFDATAVFDEVGDNRKKISIQTSDTTECYIEIERWLVRQATTERLGSGSGFLLSRQHRIRN
jgi:hypothetical protein